MNALEILLISVSVSFDALAVSMAGAWCTPKEEIAKGALTAALFFGGFQFLMPTAGYFLADSFAPLVASADHWIAFLLLILVGGKMIYEGAAELRKKEANEEKTACPAEGFFAWKRMFAPAVATSLDAFAVGAGFAFARVTLWLPAASMGVVTGIVSACGVILGRRLADLLTARCQHGLTIFGGTAICGIGIKILCEHLVKAI